MYAFYLKLSGINLTSLFYTSTVNNTLNIIKKKITNLERIWIINDHYLNIHLLNSNAVVLKKFSSKFNSNIKINTITRSL